MNGDFDHAQQAYNEESYETAFRIWMQMARQGNSFAQYKIGAMYREGRGVLCDITEAAEWFHMAARQGHKDAQYCIGYMHYRGEGKPQDDVQAYLWFALAAAQGKLSATDNKAIVEAHMTQEQIDHAQRLVSEWQANQE